AYRQDLRHAQNGAAEGRRAEAIEVLERAAARAPNNVYFPLETGKLYRSQGKPEEAVRAFQKAAPRLPGLPWAWEGLAAAQLDQGHFAEARAATQRLLELPGKPAERRGQRRQLDLCDSLLAIAADLPAILAGKHRPAQAAQQR